MEISNIIFVVVTQIFQEITQNGASAIGKYLNQTSCEKFLGIS